MVASTTPCDVASFVARVVGQAERHAARSRLGSSRRERTLRAVAMYVGAEFSAVDKLPKRAVRTHLEGYIATMRGDLELGAALHLEALADACHVLAA